MINIKMILTSLEHYSAYMYYAYSSDTLRQKDAQNLVDYIDTALETLIFTDPEIEEKNYDIAAILNEAQTLACELNYLLSCSGSRYKTKNIYHLIDKIYQSMFWPNLEAEPCA